MAGCEWVVEAYGCRPADLTDAAKLRAMFEQLIAALDLHPVGDAVWHRFPATGGMTGFQILAESHLACHTFPEYASICLNLFCCRRRPDWDFAGFFQKELGAARVNVRRIERTYQEADDPEKRELSQLRGAGSVPLV
ncbi:MAG: S-adenosylmethionine decarboxylase [Acidobacteriales bacterium]|nr:S-adenosylmethionine decarboxylase [Terriglobales bacterium]